MEAAADPQPWSLPEAPLGLSVLPSWVEPHIYWGHCSEMMRHGRTRHLVYQNSAFLHPKPQGAPRRGGCCSGQGLGSLNILCSRYGRRCSVHAVQLQIETRVSWVTRGQAMLCPHCAATDRNSSVLGHERAGDVLSTLCGYR